MRLRRRTPPDAHPSRAAWLATLDPGIAPFVNVLDAHGIETYESCEGGDGHSYKEPAVRFYGGVGEGQRATAIALQHGLPVSEIRRLWTVNEYGETHGPTWEIVFSRQARDGDVDAEWLLSEMEMCARGYLERLGRATWPSPCSGRSENDSLPL
jgi:hypothetical protein